MIKTTSVETPQDKYGDRPQIMDCPLCKCHIVTEAIKKYTFKTHLMAIFLGLLTALVLLWVPYTMGCFVTINHYCPVCESYLGTYPENER
ncbi:lipopolysaccharide-induced tumor necrosis factor-alpha factor homolog [Cimex lectularius]|uniref:LITAF domain-containing protein n=1 Tax=Cimex lectularius TaxID=79782 RepID=A0A8I6SEL9_CIMLE|nr:lipopolysaccharide-induced tumor necrosis factor-alpha factor homolog [Cimex lectularius]